MSACAWHRRRKFRPSDEKPGQGLKKTGRFQSRTYSSPKKPHYAGKGTNGIRYSIPSNSTSNTSVLLGGMSGVGLLGP